MAAPIPPMLKYSVVYNLLNFPPILIKFVSKFIVCKVLSFKAQYLLSLHSPLRTRDTQVCEKPEIPAIIKDFILLKPLVVFRLTKTGDN